jgi:hypothetical protein
VDATIRRIAADAPPGRRRRRNPGTLHPADIRRLRGLDAEIAKVERMLNAL